jgi:hypothetical protein
MLPEAAKHATEERETALGHMALFFTRKAASYSLARIMGTFLGVHRLA